jgi:hypothetical protein
MGSAALAAVVVEAFAGTTNPLSSCTSPAPLPGASPSSATVGREHDGTEHEGHRLDLHRRPLGDDPQDRLRVEELRTGPIRTQVLRTSHILGYHRYRAPCRTIRLQMPRGA